MDKILSKNVFILSQIGGQAVWVVQAEDQGNKQDPKGDESHFLQSKRIFWNLPASSPGVAPLGDPPMFEVPVLLGHLHADAADRQPDHPPRRHLLLQRWPLHKQDHLQRGLRHHLPLWYRDQLQNRRIKTLNIEEMINLSIFLTGYKEKDSSEMVILEPKLIARKYIKSWYALYQKSALPFSNPHFSPTSIS